MIDDALQGLIGARDNMLEYGRRLVLQPGGDTSGYKAVLRQQSIGPTCRLELILEAGEHVDSKPVQRCRGSQCVLIAPLVDFSTVDEIEEFHVPLPP